jgi:hypothetical protein
MIGVAKNFAATVASTTYSAFVTPFEAVAIGPPGSLTTNTVTINVSGGAPPYTYAWLKLIGDDITVADTTAASVTFSASGANGDGKLAVFRCTVTDNALDEVFVDVNVSFSFGTQL